MSSNRTFSARSLFSSRWLCLANVWCSRTQKRVLCCCSCSLRGRATSFIMTALTHLFSLTRVLSAGSWWCTTCFASGPTSSSLTRPHGSRGTHHRSTSRTTTERGSNVPVFTTKTYLGCGCNCPLRFLFTWFTSCYSWR